MNNLFLFLLAFFLTCLIEGIVLFVFKHNLFNSIKISFVLNSLTHPLFWFLMKFVFFYNFWIFLVLEIVVFLIEGLFLFKIFKFSIKKAVAFSFLINFISALIGVFI